VIPIKGVLGAISIMFVQSVVADTIVSQEEVRLIVLDDLQSVRQRLLAWAEDWSRGDAEAFLDYYSDQFISSKSLQTRAQWEKQRRQRIKPQRNIQVQLLIKELRMGPEQNSAEVFFEQNYCSKTYSDQVVKKMLWQKMNGEWYIQQESVLK